jgi:hypothetical protein
VASPNPWRRQIHGGAAIICDAGGGAFAGFGEPSGLLNVQLEHFNVMSDSELEPIAAIGVEKVGPEKILCD